MYEFNAEKVKNGIVEWIRDWFAINGPECNAVIGISGGKDSTVAAALCVEALGKDRVIGVMMPNGIQSDLDDAIAVCKYLDIKSVIFNIEDSVQAVLNNMIKCGHDVCRDTHTRIIPLPSEQTKINLPPRIRMATLYAVSQSVNGRVVCTDNCSEKWVGYSTRWGDNVGDFAPLLEYFVDEVMAIGDALGLPYELVHKTPSDGLCGKSDEDNLGVTYDQIKACVVMGTCGDPKADARIEYLHEKNHFKWMDGVIPAPSIS